MKNFFDKYMAIWEKASNLIITYIYIYIYIYIHIYIIYVNNI